jgi:hypothetical protein
MRETLALLLVVATVGAVSMVAQQQRSCVAPVAASPDSSDDGDTWDGKPAFFQKAIWRAYH